MKVKIRETGEIKDLEYLIQENETSFPQDWASEFVCECDDEDVNFLDEGDAEIEMSQETYDWWSDIFKCM